MQEGVVSSICSQIATHSFTVSLSLILRPTVTPVAANQPTNQPAPSPPQGLGRVYGHHLAVWGAHYLAERFGTKVMSPASMTGPSAPLRADCGGAAPGVEGGKGMSGVV